MNTTRHPPLSWNGPGLMALPAAVARVGVKVAADLRRRAEEENARAEAEGRKTAPLPAPWPEDWTATWPEVEWGTPLPPGAAREPAAPAFPMPLRVAFEILCPALHLVRLVAIVEVGDPDLPRPAKTRRAVELSDEGGKLTVQLMSTEARRAFWSGVWYPRRTDGYVDPAVYLYAVAADVNALDAEQVREVVEKTAGGRRPAKWGLHVDETIAGMVERGEPTELAEVVDVLDAQEETDEDGNLIVKWRLPNGESAKPKIQTFERRVREARRKTSRT